MRTNDTVRTKLALKISRFDFRVAIAMVAICVLVGILYVTSHQSQSRLLRLAGKTYRLEVASTDETRRKGLGNRNSMPKDAGMLFIFDEPEKSCFWMKDMQFDIDVIWTDSYNKVLYIVPDMKPSSYPRGYCTPEPAKYVIELNAGQAQSHNIHIGSKLSF